MRIGSHCRPDGGVEFTVWAPERERVALERFGEDAAVVPMEKGDRGYWHLHLRDGSPGMRYRYVLDGEQALPDPASHRQPDGVHEPSAVVGHGEFRWSDAGWRGIPREELVFYELHVGTFTPEGTFDAVIPRLPELKELGVTAVEIMPVAAFPGERNWGYDGVYPFAVQESYGGPEGLKRLVDAAHRTGLAVFLDVVYNHLGPEGNYLRAFGPYFTDTYHTPWGEAVNFDDAWSDEVRDYFGENARYWLEDYHLDGLRLDATHAIYDVSAAPFLRELTEEVNHLAARLGRRLHLVAESNRNDVRFLHAPDRGGIGLHAEWSDDFHHALHALLTGERSGYYADFGRCGQLAKAFAEGFVYSGQHSAYRKRRHGSSSAHLDGQRLVVFAQNHDQIGNRMLGERLSALLPFEALKLVGGAVCTAPYLPLLFMGEEYGEEAPFQYFVDHGDPDLVRAVREGRKAEFAAFGWDREPPDPQAPETRDRCRLRWERRNEGHHAVLLHLYRKLLGLRRQWPALADLGKSRLQVGHREEEDFLYVCRSHPEGAVLCLLHCRDRELALDAAPVPAALKGRWEKQLSTADPAWSGPGCPLPREITRGSPLRMAPLSFALYREVPAP